MDKALDLFELLSGAGDIASVVLIFVVLPIWKLSNQTAKLIDQMKNMQEWRNMVDKRLLLMELSRMAPEDQVAFRAVVENLHDQIKEKM